MTKGELAGYRMDLEEFRHRSQMAGLLTEQMEKELDNASRAVRISRLQATKDSLRREMQLFYGKYDQDLSDHLQKQFTDTYAAALSQLGLRPVLKLPGIDADLSRLDAVIRKPWAVDGLTFSQRLWKDQTLVVNTLHQTLTRQVALSLPPDEAVKALVTAFPEKSMRSAIGRLVMTESNAIATAGNREAYKATGVKQYEIVATLDSHTSAICQEMDGKRFPISKMEVGVTAPPFHPWCRTTTAPYDPDFEGILPPEKRAARDEDGKTYLTEARNYKEWGRKRAAMEQAARFNNMDFMKAQTRFTMYVENQLPIESRGKFVRKTNVKHNIWAKDKLESSNALAHKVDVELKRIEKQYGLKKFPPIMIADEKFLGKGHVGGYESDDKVLYLLGDRIRDFRVAAVKNTVVRSFNDAILHELGHYYHWDAVELFYNKHKKLYNNRTEAKEVMEKEVWSFLNKSSKERLTNLFGEYASTNWDTNEPYAEWFVLYHRDGGTGDKLVDELFKEVFGYANDR